MSSFNAQVLPCVFDEALCDLRTRWIVGDRVEIEQVAEVDGDEERIFATKDGRREMF